MAAKKGTRKIKIPGVSDFMKSGAQTSKSSALSPMNWTIGMLTTGLIAAIQQAAPWWCLLMIAGCLVVSICGQVGMALRFALKAPENLRSEKFLLDKIRIERALIGDTEQGLRPEDDEEVDTESAIDVGSRELVKKPGDEKP